MIKVIWNDTDNSNSVKEFDSLQSAMDWAKELEKFVTIQTNDFDIVGKFGVDQVADGKTPDGHEYSWVKRRRK